MRKICKVLSDEALEAQGRLQAIVPDSAGAEIGEEFEGVQLIEEWRGGKKLVPEEWFAEAS